MDGRTTASASSAGASTSTRPRRAKFEIRWCCTIPLAVLLVGTMVALVLTSAIPLWIGSQLILSDSSEKALDRATLLTADLAVTKVLQLFESLKNVVKEQCRWIVASRLDLDNSTEFARNIPELVVRLSKMPVTSLKVQYSNISHAAAIHAFDDPSDDEENRFMIGTWSYDANPKVYGSVMDERYGVPASPTFDTGHILDPMLPGMGSAYTDDELEHLYDRHLPLWKNLMFLPMMDCVVTEYSHPCDVGPTAQNRTAASGLYGILALRYYLCELVGSELDDELLIYIMDVYGNLISASVPWSYVEPWLDASDIFYRQTVIIKANNFTEPRVASTADVVLERLEDEEGADFRSGSWIEVSGDSWPDRVASSGVVRDYEIEGDGYFVGYSHVVNEQSRLDFVIVVVMSASEREAIMRQSTIYHVVLLAACLVFMALVVTFVARLFKPITSLTEVLYETCALFFGGAGGTSGTERRRGWGRSDCGSEDQSSSAASRPNSAAGSEFGSFWSSSAPPTAETATTATSTRDSTSTREENKTTTATQRRGCMPSWWSNAKLCPRLRLRFWSRSPSVSPSSSTFDLERGSTATATSIGGCSEFTSSSVESEHMRLLLDSGLTSLVREIRWLAHAANENRIISDVAAKNTSRRYMRYVLRDPERRTQLYVKRLPSTTVLMVDVHRFTKICERTVTPMMIAQLLTSFFSHMGHDAGKFGHPYLVSRRGDEIIFLFNSDLSERDRDHAKHALLAAVKMQRESVHRLNADVARMWPECPSDGPITVAIGVCTGDVLAGNMGNSREFIRNSAAASVDGMATPADDDGADDDEISMCYDVVGNTVNMAARSTTSKIWTPMMGEDAKMWSVRAVDRSIVLTENSMVCVMTESTYKAAFLRRYNATNSEEAKAMADGTLVRVDADGRTEVEASRSRPHTPPPPARRRSVGYGNVPPREIATKFEDSRGGSEGDVGAATDVVVRDVRWLPEGIECVECHPIAMRNISEPERIWVLYDRTWSDGGGAIGRT